MPFITKLDRYNIDENIPGHKCYLHYKWMVEKWRESPRWTTADEIYAKVKNEDQPSLDWQRAKEMAWQVFFEFYVIPYEEVKRKENGDI